MKKALFAIAMLLVSLASFAQTKFSPSVVNDLVVVAPGVVKPARELAPSYLMPPQKMFIDRKTIPAPRIGFEGVRIGSICTGTYNECTFTGGVPNANYDNVTPSSPQHNPSGEPLSADYGDDGAFRVGCKLSHMSFDDPIVYPGQSGKNHLHQFFGNSLTNGFSDVANMSEKGRSSCGGGIVNRTGYWTPVLIYSCPPGSPQPGCDLSRDGEVIPAGSSNFYYKGGYTAGITSTGGIQWAPDGLRIIAGNASATSPSQNAKDFIFFDCFANDGNSGGPAGRHFDHIPSKAELQAVGTTNCDNLNFNVTFPECWNGVDLDSADHRSHMQRASFNSAGDLGCYDPAYPVHIPTISTNLNIPVVYNDMDYYRLSSDPPRSSGVPPGSTAHADWANGWSRATNLVPGYTGRVTDLVVRNCLLAKRDCHVNILGIVPETNNSDAPATVFQPGVTYDFKQLY